MSRKLMMCVLCAVGVSLMVFAITSRSRISTLAASNKALNLQDYPDVRLVTLGIIDDKKVGSIDAAKVVGQIEMRLMLMIGTGFVMTLVGIMVGFVLLRSHPRIE